VQVKTTSNSISQQPLLLQQLQKQQQQRQQQLRLPQLGSAGSLPDVAPANAASDGQQQQLSLLQLKKQQLRRKCQYTAGATQPFRHAVMALTTTTSCCCCDMWLPSVGTTV
jgi:hypothetical protein